MRIRVWVSILTHIATAAATIEGVVYPCIKTILNERRKSGFAELEADTITMRLCVVYEVGVCAVWSPPASAAPLWVIQYEVNLMPAATAFGHTIF
jgi:hypothetical protein